MNESCRTPRLITLAFCATTNVRFAVNPDILFTHPTDLARASGQFLTYRRT